MTKNKKKIQRKLKRAMCIVESVHGPLLSESPSKIVLVANGGLICGVDNSVLLQLFERCGPIEDIITPLDASYSFVVFENMESAVFAVEELNGEIGKPEIGKNEKPFYLAYANNVPRISHEILNCLPPGCRILEDFCSEDEEKELMLSIGDELDSNCHQSLKNRQVLHFGYAFNYDINNVDLKKPLSRGIPQPCLQMLSKCPDLNIPDQLTVNQYQPGQGIPQHVDTHSAFEGPILSLSLGSQISMQFNEPTSNRRLSVFLPRRSLLIMDGESRYLWNHGITCRMNDVVRNDEGRLEIRPRFVRTSFTFRKVRRDKRCFCNYPERCDSQKPKIDEVLELSEDQAKCLEAEHVHRVYNSIAEHFSETRHKPWPRISKFLDGLDSGSLVLDVGCGNGKYLNHHSLNYQLGCDLSVSLLEICRDRNLEVAQVDILNIPFRSNVLDASLCIAVLHHLATLDRRLKAVKQLCSVLRLGGRLLIYVWSLEQEKDKCPSNYIKPTKIGESASLVTAVDGLELPVHVNRTKFVKQDLLVPWKSQDYENATAYRFYHVFRKGELEELVAQIPGVRIVESFYDKGNWGVELKKVSY